MDKINNSKIAMYTIYDKKGKRYDTPFFAFSDVHAKRQFIMMVEGTGMIAQFKDDFELYKLLYFDIPLGDIELLRKELIMTGTEYIKKEDKK